MSFKLIPTKITRKDLLALYDITHPTLRTWLQRAGLGYFKGRRKFLAQEVVLIFQAIGRPQLARRAAQRLKDVYARINGLLPDDVRFEECYQQAPPKQHQDQLPNSEEEIDAPAVHPIEQCQTKGAIALEDALVRLTITSILLRGQKEQKRLATLTTKPKQRKALRKGLAKKRSHLSWAA